MRAVFVCLVACVGAAVAFHVPVQKLDSDVHQLARAVKESQMSLSAKQENLDLLKKIDHEIKSWSEASPAHRQALKSNIHSQMKQVHQNLNAFASAHSTAKANTNTHNPLAETVTKDVAALRAALEESNLPESVVDTMQQKLDDMSETVSQLEENGDSALLRKQIQSDMKQVKQALSNAAPVATNSKETHAIQDQLHVMENKIAESSLDLDTKVIMNKNLKAIQKDILQLEEASSQNMQANLKQAISLRMKALHQALAGKNADSLDLEQNQDETQKPTAAVQHVLGDVAKVQAIVAESTLSVESRRRLTELLTSIHAQTESLATASADERAELKAKITDDVKQMKAIATSGTETAKFSLATDSESLPTQQLEEQAFLSASKVQEDLVQLRMAIGTASNLPMAMQTEMLENIKAINNDYAAIHSSPERATQLKKAIKLRVKALREQMQTARSLEEDNNNENDDVAEEPKANEKTAKIETDLEAINTKLTKLKKAVRQMDLPQDLEADVMADMKQMEHDLARARAGEDVPKMQKALKLRLQALKELLADA